MNKLKAKYLILFPFFLISALNAQVRFYASTDMNKIPVGSFFEIHFVVENGDGDNFIAPKFDNLKLISGPNQMSSYSNINGRVSSKEEYVYRFIAEKTGTINIGKASINIKGKKYYTDPLQLNIIANKNQDSKNINTENDYFIRAETEKNKYYIGEQIILKYNLYRRVDITNYNIDNIPDFTGFNYQQIENNFQSQKIKIKDKTYIVNTLAAFVLWPKLSGKSEIGVANFTIGLPDNNNRNPFFRSEIPKHISSNTITFEITNIKDENFKGLIGNYNISASIDSKDIKVGEAISLIVNIKSNSEPNTIFAPDLKDKIKDFEVYDPKQISENTDFINGKLVTTKSFEYLLVPEKPGNQNIEFGFEYFNTDSQTIENANIDAISLDIKPNPDYKKIKSDTNNNYNKLQPLAKIQKIDKKSHFPNYGFLMIIVLIIFSIILLLIIFIKYKSDKNKKISPILIKERKAEYLALKKLQKAKEFLETNNNTEFYKEIISALTKYISDKYQANDIDITTNNLHKILETKISDISLIDQYFQITNKCQSAIYGGNQNSDLHDIYDKSVQLIKDFEKYSTK